MPTQKQMLEWFEKLYNEKEIYCWGADHTLINKANMDRLYSIFKTTKYNRAYYDNILNKYEGKTASDCSGAFTGISGIDTTAQGYYNKASVKGLIKDLPKDKICLVFRGSSKSTIWHIGLYCGDGNVIHLYNNCQKQKLDSTWKYYALAHFCSDYDTYSTTYGKEQPTEISFLKDGVFVNREWIRSLQKQLNVLGYKDKNGKALQEDGLVGELTYGVLNSIVIKGGSKSPVVELVQQKLKYLLGYNLGAYGVNEDGCDGHYGARTVESIKDFQTKNGLTSDGIIGLNTWKVFVPNEGEQDMVKKIKLTPKSTMTQIQNALKTTNAEITFESGTYNITKTLYLYSDTIIKATGARFAMGAAIHNIFMTYTTANTTGYNGAKNIKWYGGTIEGMGKYNVNLNLLTLWHAKDCYINGLTLKDVVGFHSVEINGSSGIILENCSFEGYNVDKTFREMIQLDYSSESAIFVHPSKSKCYDLTPCKDIKILNCTFKESASRPSYYTAIGNHAQGVNCFHDGVLISDCKFIGRGDSGTPAIRLVGMKNVTIQNCDVEKSGRFVEIYNCKYSYTKDGKQIAPTATDGCCSNVVIKGNRVKDASGNNRGTGVYAHSNTTGKHRSIVIESNRFDKSKTNKKEGYYAWIEDVEWHKISNNTTMLNAYFKNSTSM